MLKLRLAECWERRCIAADNKSNSASHSSLMRLFRGGHEPKSDEIVTLRICGGSKVLQTPTAYIQHVRPIQAAS